MEYERLEPFGALRDNWHTAMLATILANAHRDPKKPPVRMSEFFYQDPDTVEEKNNVETLECLRAMKRRKARG